MRIQLVLADDWELRGDGSGDMRVIQFATIRSLCEVYEACGLPASFNMEVLHQLVHRRLGNENRELGRLAASGKRSFPTSTSAATTSSSTSIRSGRRPGTKRVAGAS